MKTASMRPIPNRRILGTGVLAVSSAGAGANASAAASSGAGVGATGIALGLMLGLLMGLLLQAPASWLSSVVALATEQRVLLLNPQGTLWQGSADGALSDGQHTLASTQSAQQAKHSPQAQLTKSSTHTGPLPTHLPSRVHWRIRPHMDWTQAAFGLQLVLQSDCCTPTPVQIFIAPGWQGLRISSLAHHSQVPASWLVGLGAPWNTLQPEGQLQLRSQSVQWQQAWSAIPSQAKLTGQIELQWLDCSTRLSTLRPLGHYRMVVTGGDTMQLQLDTLQGSLQLQGRGEWLQGRLRFRGEAKAQPDAEAAVSNLLNVLGQRRGNVSLMELG